MTIKLGGRLPKEWTEDGLQRMQQTILADPASPQVIIAVVVPVAVKTDLGSGERDVSLQITKIEAPLDPNVRDQLLTLLEEMNEERIGRVPLPLDSTSHERAERDGGAKLFDLRTGTGFHPGGAAGGGA